MKRVFITGIPTSGKSHLARKAAKKVGGIHIEIDKICGELGKDKKYKKWHRFYIEKDEKKYFESTPCEEQWNNLVRQSEGLGPGILEKIKPYENETRPIIFEGVNILPHLAKQDLNFSGVVIIGKSFEDIFERNKKAPRWGNTEELQRMEAEAFFNCEHPYYKTEGLKYGFKVFETSDKAEAEVLKILKT